MINNDLIQNCFFSVNPWAGVKGIQSELLRHGFAVVTDDDGFWGILTPKDILEKNHRLVIDCLRPTPYLLPTDNLPDVLNLMYSCATEVLPFIENRKLKGIVTKCSITGYYQQLTDQLNITNHKLKESEGKYRLLVESLNEGVWQIDENSNTTFVNRCMANMLGYEIEDIIGKPITIFMDDQGKNKSEVILDNIKNGYAKQYDFDFIRKDGRRISTILESSPLFDEQGCYKGAIAGVLDITERKRAEVALQRSQKKLRAIIDHVPAAIFWKDKNNRYLGCNQQFADYVGMSVSEVIGKTDNNMPWKEFKEEYIKEDLKVFKTGNPIINFEKQGKNCKGRITWLRVSKVPLSSPDGKEIMSIIGIFEDITEQKAKDIELNEYKNQLEQLVKERTFELNEAQRIGNIGNWKYDAVSKRLIWSDEVFRIFERDKTNFTPTLEEFGKHVYPDDISLLTGLYHESLRGKKPYSTEHRIITGEGTLKWVHERCENYFDTNGRYIKSVGTVQDITHRKRIEHEIKEKEHEFELFFENVNEVVLIFNEKGETVYVNREFEKLFALPLQKQMSNPLLFIESIHTDDKAKFSELFARQFTRANASLGFSYEFRLGRNRKTKWLQAKSLPVFNGLTHPSRHILLITDITQSKHIQREILSAITLAEERERTRFAQDLHDGIGPLLSTIKIYIQWLNRPESKANKTTLFHQAECTIDEAIESTREISHNLSPNLLIRFGLISALTSFVGRINSTRNNIISFSHCINSKVEFESETTIYRVAVECINNAIKHSGASKINLSIHENQRFIVVQIKDNGIGFILKKALSSKNGIGLKNVVNRIETAEGRVSINSAPNKGTTITIELPVEKTR